MSFFSRFILGTLFFLSGWLCIGFLMEVNGSASRYNPAWRLIGPFYHVILFSLKWSFYLGLTGSAVWLVIFLFKQWCEWHEASAIEDEKQKIQDERVRSEVVFKASWEAQRIADLAIIKKYEAKPELIPSPPKSMPMIPEYVAPEPPKPKLISAEEAKRRAIDKIIGR